MAEREIGDEGPPRAQHRFTEFYRVNAIRIFFNVANDFHAIENEVLLGFT